MIDANAQKKSGIGTTTAGTGDNLFRVSNNGSSRFLVDGDGDVYVGNSGCMSDVHDTWDDVLLARTIDINRAHHGADAHIQYRWEDFITYNECTLVDFGILCAPLENGGMLNITKLQRLHNGAIWQLHSQIQDQREELTALKGQMEALMESK